MYSPEWRHSVHTDICIQTSAYRQLHTDICIQTTASDICIQTSAYRQLHTDICIQTSAYRHLHTDNCIQTSAYRQLHFKIYFTLTEPIWCSDKAVQLCQEVSLYGSRPGKRQSFINVFRCLSQALQPNIMTVRRQGETISILNFQ
jgi:hypothetical protein